MKKQKFHKNVFDRMEKEIPQSRASLGGYHTGKRDAYLNIISDLTSGTFNDDSLEQTQTWAEKYWHQLNLRYEQTKELDKQLVVNKEIQQENERLSKENLFLTNHRDSDIKLYNNGFEEERYVMQERIIELEKENELMKQRLLMPVGFYEGYESLQQQNKAYESALKEFVDKNFHGGAKSNREDYSTMVTTADIYKLKEVLSHIK